MSAADCKSARRKMILRYRNPGNRRSVAESIAIERQKAARQAAAKKKK